MPSKPWGCRTRRSGRLLSLRDTARAMSQENVEIVRRVFDAFNRRDIPAFLELLDPDVEWVPSWLCWKAVSTEDTRRFGGGSRTSPRIGSSSRWPTRSCAIRRPSPGLRSLARSRPCQWGRVGEPRHIPLRDQRAEKSCRCGPSLTAPRPSKPRASRSRRCRSENLEDCRAGCSKSFGQLKTEDLQAWLDEFIDPDVDWRAVEGATTMSAECEVPKAIRPLRRRLAGHVR